METTVSDYAVCAKCGKRYSTLTRHRCFTAKGQKENAKGEAKEHDLESGPECESLDEHEGKHDEADGEGKNETEGKGQSKPRGEGEADADGDGQGDGEGEQGEGDTEGEGQGDGQGEGEQEGEGEGEGEAPVPQMPEPETPPVAVVCTVLKFAALTAQCAKNGAISVTVEEDGLFVCGHNGDLFAHKTIPWGEFEKRSTLDGEFYVKEIIDGVDEQIGQTAKVDVDAVIAKYKREPEPDPEKPEPEPEAPKLTLPLTVGQRVVCRDGKVRTVAQVVGTTVNFDSGECVWRDHQPGYEEGRGGVGGTGGAVGTDRYYDALADAKLTIPFYVGQRVLTAGGTTAVIETGDGDGRVYAMHEEGVRLWHRAEDGKAGRSDYSSAHKFDLVADAPKPTLTLPLTTGQKVKLRNGQIATVREDGGGDTIKVGYYRKQRTWWADAATGHYCGGGGDYPKDAVADA